MNILPKVLGGPFGHQDIFFISCYNSKPNFKLQEKKVKTQIKVDGVCQVSLVVCHTIYLQAIQLLSKYITIGRNLIDYFTPNTKFLNLVNIY